MSVLRAMVIAFLIFVGFNVAYCSTNFKPSLASNVEFKKLCVILAIPGKQNGPDLSIVKTLFENQMNIIGHAIFGNVSNSDVMKMTANCTFLESSTPECAYRRIKIISQYMFTDLHSLQNELVSGFMDAPELYTVLLSAWYLDRVFLDINCGPVNLNTLLPVVQWKFVAKWSNLLESREKFCMYSKPLGKIAARSLRQDVRSICSLKNEPLCQLVPMFDMVDSMQNFCDLVPVNEWGTFGSTNYEYFKNAAFLSFYTIRQKAPNEISNEFNINTNQPTIQQGILSIFFKLYDNFRDADLTLATELLRVLPKSIYLPCNFNSEFPTFEWLLCACGRSFSELRVYIQNHQAPKAGTKQTRKYLVANYNYREYIKNLKVSQIKELSEKNAVSLQVVAADIKNNIQDRFQQLGNYFRKVADFETSKLMADVDYLNGKIHTYTERLNRYSSDLSSKMEILFGIFIGTSTSDVAQAVAKMAIRMSMAANPFKWLTDSGNSDDILESASEIAQASLLLTRAISSAVNFNKLAHFSQEISRNLSKNGETISIVGKILRNAKSATTSPNVEFGKYQSNFLENYRDYSPQVSKDDLAKLGSYWDLFIEEVCSGIESTSSVIAISIRGPAGTSGRCLDAKNQAVQLVTCLEEIYDFQFDLMEQMASLMHSYTQIESSKILGNGPKAPNPNNLTVDAIKTLIAVSSVSYIIMQTTNVEMLCNIMEYQQGYMPSLCSGLSTDIDKLLSLKDPICRPQLYFISVPTKPAFNNSNDHSWIDLSKLYKGEIIHFKIPDSNRLVDRLELLPSEKLNIFFVAGIEIYVPVVSQEGRSVSYLSKKQQSVVSLIPVTQGISYKYCLHLRSTSQFSTRVVLSSRVPSQIEEIIVLLYRTNTIHSAYSETRFVSVLR